MNDSTKHRGYRNDACSGIAVGCTVTCARCGRSMWARQYIVVTPRVEGSPETGYRTVYYTDGKLCGSLPDVKHHGMVDLQQSDDFLIGRVAGNQLVSLQWMDELRDDRGELVSAAADMGFEVAP